MRAQRRGWEVKVEWGGLVLRGSLTEEELIRRENRS